MLYFRTKPDSVFLAVLSQSLETELKEVSRISREKDFDAWVASYAQTSLSFTPYSAFVTFEQLVEASRDVIVYRLTDYHWLLLYECLKNYCTLHNDMARDEKNGRLNVGGYDLQEIDFDQIVKLYFWDSDFLFLAEGKGPFPALNAFADLPCDETIDLTAGICPLPAQLKLVAETNPTWNVHDPDEYFGPESARYPDFWQDFDYPREYIS